MQDEPFLALMQQGSRLHAAGRLPESLAAFEQARRVRPGDMQAASACATLLTATGQPQAAWQVLASVREALWADTEGAANLAIAAEACGRMEDARAAYLRALELDPRNLRALRNTALLAARAGAWDGAITTLRRCVELAPDDPQSWLMLADILVQARRFAEVDPVLDHALRRFPGHVALQLRQPLAWAFGGQLDRAQQRFDAMPPTLRTQAQALLRPGAPPAATAPALLDARHLFCQQALDAMQHCHWQDRARLAKLLRTHAEHAATIFPPALLQDILQQALWLDLDDAVLLRLHGQHAKALAALPPDPAMPAFVATRFGPRDGRLRIGLAVPSLHDPRVADALEQQLRRHDTRRFALHVYSPTPQPDLQRHEALAAYCRGFAEIAHMRPAEALGRVRLDELDIYMDMAVDTPWWRPELAARRVAPVQLRAAMPLAAHVPGLYDYALSDSFVHPPGAVADSHGSIARLATSCWLASTGDAPEPRWCSRTDLGLPEDQLVLCTTPTTAAWDPEAFARWMELLRAVPHAVLWLPAYPQSARQQLALAAQAGGIAPERLVFMAPATRAQWLGRLPLADLYVNGMPGHAPADLSDALRMGVPAVTCVGRTTPSRIGGSILRAAGLPECIHDTAQALVQYVGAWGGAQTMRTDLRTRTQALRATAALYRVEPAVRALEAVWTRMAERHAAGLAPVAFDAEAAPG